MKKETRETNNNKFYGILSPYHLVMDDTYIFLYALLYQ